MTSSARLQLAVDADALLDGPPPADPALRQERERLLRNRRAKTRRQRKKQDQVRIVVYLPREGLADLMAAERSLSRRAGAAELTAAVQLYLLEQIAARQPK